MKKVKSDKFEVVIIGPGKVGAALGALYRKNGGLVAAVGGRNPEKTRKAAEIIGGDTKALDIFEASELGDQVILSVSDDSIKSVCLDIALKGKFREEAVVVHCSGALDGSVLEQARLLRGCHVGSMHPLQTFPTVESAVDRLPEAYCFYEGDEKAVVFIEHFADVAGMKYAPISGNGKALYHASAVMACNYLASLMAAAVETAALAGVDGEVAWKALEPLAKATLRNIGELGPAKALTGPVARGDLSTVKRHLEALEREAPSLAPLYRALGTKTASIAVDNRSISLDEYKKLSKALSVFKNPNVNYNGEN